MFTAVSFTTAKTWEQPKCPSVEEQIKKMWYTYTVEHYLASKRKEILLLATTCTELEDTMLKKKNLVTEGQILHDLT